MVTAAGSTAQATSLETQNDPYEKFWEILNKEAELVVQFNATRNTTLAQELIQNSRLGAENAANISALIWQALEELKASGVKTYYTAEELREMARNISRNGLPQETVEALKAQGWSDEQIQALEEYIVRNADEINEDFNMTAFLEEFSMAFIDVAFKYNEYETWTLEKWKWTQPTGITGGDNRTLIHPLLLRGWVEFYRSYVEGDYKRMRDSIIPLRESMYELITYSSNSPKQVELAFFNGESITITTGNLRGVLWGHDGSMAFRIEQEHFDRDGFEINLTTYYWPGALEAYKLTSDVLVLVNAMKQGNNNPKLPKMLNQKVAELKDALEVTVVSREVITNPDYKKLPPSDPITPIDPINPEPLKNSIKGVDGGTLTPTESSSNQIPVIPADEIMKIASDPGSLEGILKVDDIEVKPLTSGPNYVNYRVIVHMHTENNAVKNVKINLHDYSTGRSDSETISQIDPYIDYNWESKTFSTSIRNENGKLTATGEIEITYTPECDKSPLGSREDAPILSSCSARTITEQYSATFDLSSSVDWNLVGIKIETSSDDITEGDSVTYKVVVENKNNVALNGVDYSVVIPYSDSGSWKYSGTVDVPANEEVTIIKKTVTYEEAGTYVASASIKWDGNSKSVKKSVTVNSETISMNVDFSPNNPTEGDSVEFDVSLKNPTSTSRTVTVKLFIDGVEKSSRTVTLHGGDSMIVTLTWTAQAGEHDWRIEAWEDGKLEDSRSGTIRVISESDPCPEGEYWTAWLEVSPTEMVGEGKVHVKVMASYCSALPDVGGDTIDLLYLGGSVYLDGKEIHSFDTNANGNYLLVGRTRVIDEFDWPVSVGNHNITLKIKNISGLLDYIKTKTDSVSVRVSPLEYSLELTEISCSGLNFNFKASRLYTQGSYVSSLECTLKFRNVNDVPVHITELSTEISVSPPDLEEAVPDHTTVSVNEDVKPGEFITIQIQDRTVTTDRQMLLRVDGTTATLYLDYTVEGMINGVSKIVVKGIAESTLRLSVNQGIVYADVTADLLLLIEGPKVSSKLTKWFPVIDKIPGGDAILSFISGQPIKNFILSKISEHQG
ncbi:hypothetical protein CL1_0324 [Thermococcus cleftensis]|uniref:CARDB domain-containing protein n=2 Tax=Thermococcus cleftensis (strain DSM 27260 / KACC 17922 / CL1) TaxID=163003 RepID=I3ZS51_THECF|nr:hypothetical protein CL1_0324 [Thermococcus cleftensis]